MLARLSVMKFDEAEKFSSFRIDVGLMSNRAENIDFKHGGMDFVAK